MERKLLVMSAIGAAVSSFMAMGADAAPLNASMGAATSHVEQVARRCWVENGVRYCSRSRNDYRDDNRSDYRVRNIPEAYPTGSKYWWEEMDRQNRGGRGGRG